MHRLIWQILLIFLFPALLLYGNGNLFIIGGGKRPPVLITKIVELAGGASGSIVIIPMASGSPESTAEYQKSQFLQAGIQSADYILFDRISVDSKKNLDKVEQAKAVFFSGGDQRRLTALLMGTQLLAKIKDLYLNGGLIAGTSAGAAVMSSIMITGDELLNPDTTRKFISIRKSNIKTSEGLGFITSAIIDQHFIKRKRHNRLISLVLENPELLGIGIDESTAIWVSPDGIFEVIGDNAVIIYDASAVKNPEYSPAGLLGGYDIKMHIMLNTDKFDLNQRRPVLDE
jgi:cyanophycinase